MDNPLISVIIPIYNTEKYMRETIDSVLNQTYTTLEIILVDDGTPDRGGEICDEYAQKDKRVIVIHKENGGISSARNAGLDICKGEYITCVDSDDVVCPDMINCLLSLIERYNADVAMCGLSTFVDGQSFEFIHSDKSIELSLLREEALERLLYWNQTEVSTCAKLVKRGLYKDIRFPNGKLYEDFYTTYRLMAAAARLAQVSDAKYMYRIRDGSIERQPFALRKMDCIELAQAVYDCVCSDFPNLAKAALCSLLNAYFHIFFMIPLNQYHSETDIIWEKITQCRANVLLDHKARPKTRAAALLSLSGKWITHRLGKKLLNRLNRKRGMYLPS